MINFLLLRKSDNDNDNDNDHTTFLTINQSLIHKIQRE